MADPLRAEAERVTGDWLDDRVVAAYALAEELLDALAASPAFLAWAVREGCSSFVDDGESVTFDGEDPDDVVGWLSASKEQPLRFYRPRPDVAALLDGAT